jgi:hypothetical protein
MKLIVTFDSFNFARSAGITEPKFAFVPYCATSPMLNTFTARHEEDGMGLESMEE